VPALRAGTGGGLLGGGGVAEPVYAAADFPAGDQPVFRHGERHMDRRVRLCVWPPADCVYKADTNDTRESPAIRICPDLLDKGAILQIGGPKVSKRQIALDPGQPPCNGEGSWHQVPDAQQAAAGEDELLLLTKWKHFTRIDWLPVAAVMRWRRGRRDCRCRPWERAELFPPHLLPATWPLVPPAFLHNQKNRNTINILSGCLRIV